MTLTLREALASFRRSPLLSALSVTTIAFALFVVGLFGLVALNLRAALTAVEERVEIVLYLRRGTPVEAATLAMSDIEAFPEVQSAAYVSEDEALRRARRELTEFQGVLGDLQSNPLPASLEIRLKPGFRSSTHVNAVAERLRGFRFAEDVRFGRDWIEKLDRLRDVAAVVGLAVGSAFAVASVIIIGTTIRMGVLHRAREISIMRLVGATDGFVRRPFLLEGALKGALGGIGAVALNHAAFFTVDRMLFDAAFFSPAQVGLMVLFGTGLGLLASAVSVRRHLGSPR
ncbi:MAG TPA: permease-like cell division protein FtsX [Gemmatimonadales bacterium]|nr:permease-like cell division protein FtsX [Gemmatimonadales bacterium]